MAKEKCLHYFLADGKCLKCKIDRSEISDEEMAEIMRKRERIRRNAERKALSVINRVFAKSME